MMLPVRRDKLRGKCGGYVPKCLQTKTFPDGIQMFLHALYAQSSDADTHKFGLYFYDRCGPGIAQSV